MIGGGRWGRVERRGALRVRVGSIGGCWAERGGGCGSKGWVLVVASNWYAYAQRGGGC